jgi:hypothetical protein
MLKKREVRNHPLQRRLFVRNDHRSVSDHLNVNNHRSVTSRSESVNSEVVHQHPEQNPPRGKNHGQAGITTHRQPGNADPAAAHLQSALMLGELSRPELAADNLRGAANHPEAGRKPITRMTLMEMNWNL